MNDLTIPGWAVITFTAVGGGLIGWLIWLTKTTFANQEKIAVNTANDQKVGEELEKIYTKVNETKSELQNSFDKMERKIDLFMVNEITLLKQMIPGTKG